MKHPYEKLSPQLRRNLYWGFLAATFIIAVVLGIQGQGFATTVPGEPAPFNIVHFELAGTPEQALRITESWGASGRAAAFGQTVVDYLFLLSYPNAIALGILAVLMNTRNRTVWMAGRNLAWLQWLAGALDAVENLALLGILKGHVVSPLPEIAWWCAAPKFLIVIAGILFVLVGVAWGFTRRDGDSVGVE
jgi:hypothetical protein